MNSKEFEHDKHTRKERKQMRKIASKTDRSKFKKTDSEKREKKLLVDSEEKLKKLDVLRGRVLSITLKGILVESEGHFFSCMLRGALKKESSKLKNLITVGDEVYFEKTEPDEGAIVLVGKRRTLFSRIEPLRQKEQLIAANIDIVLITTSVGSPPFNPAFVDRAVIAAQKGNMQPVILINKVDLLHKKEAPIFEAWAALYRQLGFIVLFISTTTKKGLDALREVMRDRASVFAGESGVGKSSLISEMIGRQLITAEVTRKTMRGVHTTTRAELLPLPFGGWCVDTPGIQNFGLWKLSLADLREYFTEIDELSKECKFRGCSHTHEPKCRVLKALEDNELSPLRYISYKKLLGEILPS